MSEELATTEEIRAEHNADEFGIPAAPGDPNPRFDLWLAEHDREVSAKAREKALELTNRELQEGVGAMYREDLFQSNASALNAAITAIREYRQGQR